MNKTAVSSPHTTNHWRTHWRLGPLLLLFLALTLFYNAAVPLFEAPDEMDHLRYAHWLAEGHGLPHLVTDRASVGEIWQPPLYYALIAAIIAPIDRSDMATIAPLNPHWPAGFGKLAHYHTEAEQFPYQGTSLAVHAARLVSALLGVITIICTYGMAWSIIPRYALIAAALVAFNPQFVFMSAVVNNDNLVIALCSAVVWWAVWQGGRPGLPWRQYGFVGLLWGGAVLAKLTGLGLGGVLAVALGVTAVRHKTWRPVGGGVLAGVTAVLVCGWWFGRNWQLYGDPLAWQQMLAVTQGLLRPERLTLPETLVYASFLRQTYWAMFGYGLPAPPVFYWFVYGVVLAALAGWVRLLGKSGRRLLFSPALLLVIWSAVVFVLLLRWMQQIETTNQGRLLFPAIGSLAVLLAMGVAALDGQRQRLGKGIIIILGVWAATLPLLVIGPAYARPAPLAATAVIPHPTNVIFGDSVQLLGYELPTAVTPGEPVEVTLYWQALQPVTESYAVAVRILDADQQVVTGVDSVPYQARFPTVVWPVGRPFQDTVQLPPAATTATPGLGTLVVILYPLGAPGTPLPVAAYGQPTGAEARLANLKINPAQTASYAPAQTVMATFGSQFRLLGFELSPDVAAARPLTVTLYWEGVQPDGRDYTIFLHLTDTAGTLQAQADGPPQNNHYPTSIWTAGEQIRDPHVLALPAEMSPGRYVLYVGLYDPATGERLPAFNTANIRYPHDSVELTPVFWEP